MTALHPTAPGPDLANLLHRGYEVVDHLPHPDSGQWRQYLADIDWDDPTEEVAGQDLLTITRELLGALEAVAGTQFRAAS